MKQDWFVKVLSEEFAKKKARNKAYSLRSFARDLELDPSNLSKILKGQKEVGPRLQKKLAPIIGISESELEAIGSAEARIADRDYQAHSIEAFKVISSAHHYAILELFKLTNFEPTPKAIASRLGLTVTETQNSLRRLVHVGLLRKDSAGRLVPIDDSSSSILAVATSKAHRDQQREILDGAITALESIPLEFRSQSSMTMAVDVARLDEARALIKKFRRQLDRLMSASSNLNEVYQLSISLYPVSMSQKITK
jgi:transcriptional regulator with XRE-family HTH domain